MGRLWRGHFGPNHLQRSLAIHPRATILVHSSTYFTRPGSANRMACDGSQHLIAETTRGGRIGERVASVPRWRYREYGERCALVASGVCPNFLYGDPLLYTLRVSTRYDEPTALFCKYCLWEHIVYNGRNYIMDPLTGWWEQDFEYCYCIYLDRCGCLLRMGIPYFVQGSFELHICDVCSNNGIFDMEERYAGFADIICQAAFRPLRALVVFWRGQSDSKKLHTLGQFLRMKDWLRLRLLKRMAVPGSPSCLHHVVDTIAWLAEKKTCLANALNLFSTWESIHILTLAEYGISIAKRRRHFSKMIQDYGLFMLRLAMAVDGGGTKAAVSVGSMTMKLIIGHLGSSIQ